jgi:hypothetical protein
MKPVDFVLLLIAVLAFVLVGCSDRSVQPVSPNEQAVGAPPGLAKSTQTPFYGTMWQDVLDPGFLVDPGVIKNPDGKTTIKGVQQKAICAATFPAGATDLFSGNAIITLDGIASTNADYTAGEGFFYGKATVTPTNGGGGVWKLSWHAKGTLGPFPAGLPPAVGSFGWIIPLKEEGPGVGGTLTGKHIFMDNKVYCTPDFQIWVGVYSGHVK